MDAKFVSILIFYVFTFLKGEGTKDIVYTVTDSITGSVQVMMQSNQIMVKTESEYMNMHARNFTKVVLGGGKKIYHSAPFGFNSSWFIFETLSDGKVPLLYREGIKMSDFDENTFPPFYMLIDGSVYSLESKKQVLEVFDDQKDIIKDYMKDNKVDFEDRESLTNLFSFYNSRVES